MNNNEFVSRMEYDLLKKVYINALDDAKEDIKILYSHITKMTNTINGIIISIKKRNEEVEIYEYVNGMIISIDNTNEKVDQRINE